MSTKSTIAHGANFHFYTDAFDLENVYLQLDGARFEASNEHCTIAIPIAIWEVLRQNSAVDLSFADITDRELLAIVEKTVQERIDKFALANESEKPVVKLAQFFVYGSAEDLKDTQISSGMDHYRKLRERQLKIRSDIYELSCMKNRAE